MMVRCYSSGQTMGGIGLCRRPLVDWIQASLTGYAMPMRPSVVRLRSPFMLEASCTSRLPAATRHKLRDCGYAKLWVVIDAVLVEQHEPQQPESTNASEQVGDLRRLTCRNRHACLGDDYRVMR